MLQSRIFNIANLSFNVIREKKSRDFFVLIHSALNVRCSQSTDSKITKLSYHRKNTSAKMQSQVFNLNVLS